VPKREELHGNQPLVVVGGDDGVELAADSPHEEAVRRKRSRHVEPFRAETRHGGAQHALLLVAKEAALSRVRVEAAERDAPRCRAETGQLPMDEARHAAGLVGGHGPGDARQ
jgi:hypothetical protein